MMMKAESARSAGQMESPVLDLVAFLMAMISGFGSLLAAGSAAKHGGGRNEIRHDSGGAGQTGASLGVSAGQVLGVQLLMAVYVLFMFAFSYLLAWIGGERIQTTPWVLIVYPLVRYAIYSAISMFLVTMMHPMTAFGIVLLTANLGVHGAAWIAFARSSSRFR